MQQGLAEVRADPGLIVGLAILVGVGGRNAPHYLYFQPPDRQKPTRVFEKQARSYRCPKCEATLLLDEEAKSN